MTRDELILIDQRIEQIKKDMDDLSHLLADHDLIYWSLENARSELSNLRQKLSNEQLLTRRKELGFQLIKNVD